MKRVLTRFGWVSVVLGLVLAFNFAVSAEEPYPSKQINWYIHSSAGGGTDIYSRTVAMPLRRILKTNIVISSMTGGSGARMLNYLMEQPADGYTICSIANSVLFTIARGNTKAKRSDIVGISRGCYDPQSFCVSTKGRFKSIQELVAFGKANPDKVKFGVTHMAGLDQVTAYEFNKAAGFKAEIVPFKSGGEIIVALMGGVIDAGVLNPSEFLGQYEAGNVKPIVFLVPKRLEGFPDVPTAKELGYDVEMATWRGIIIKAGTPAPIVEKLRDAFAKAMQKKIYKNYLRDNFMGPDSIMSGKEWEAFMDKEYPIYKATMKELGYIKK